MGEIFTKVIKPKSKPKNFGEVIILITNFSNDKNSKGDRMNEQFTYEFRKKSKKLQFMSDRAQEILEHFCNDNLSGSIPIVEIFIKFGFRIYQSYLEPEEIAGYIEVTDEIIG